MRRRSRREPRSLTQLCPNTCSSSVPVWDSTTPTCPGARSSACSPGAKRERARAGVAVVERRRRRAGVEPQASALPAAGGRRHPAAAAPRCASDAVRRAALPLQLLLPRRRRPSRAARRGGRPPRPGGAGDHRPRRVLRRRPLRRGGPGRRPAHGVRRRADAQRAPGPLVRSEQETQRQPRVADRERHAPDPHGGHLVVLADGPAGTPRWPRRSASGTWRGRRALPAVRRRRPVAAPWPAAWGCSPGAARVRCRRALTADGSRGRGQGAAPADRVVRSRPVPVELWDHGDPLDSVRNDALVELAARHHVACVATNNVHYATPAQRRLATAVAAVRARQQPRRARSLVQQLVTFFLVFFLLCHLLVAAYLPTGSESGFTDRAHCRRSRCPKGLPPLAVKLKRMQGCPCSSDPRLALAR